MFKPAQLIALCQNGLPFQFVTEPVDLVVNPEPEVLQLYPNSEEDSAITLKNLKLAIPNHAQLTASCPLSLHGVHVIRHAELDLNPELDLFKLMPNLEEFNAVLLLKHKPATHYHALSTVFWVFGLNGASAQ